MWPPRTLAITDRHRLRGDDLDAALVAYVRALARAGVDLVQVRERDWDDLSLWRVTRAAVRAVRHTGCRVVVNERAHVAWAAGAHGVHLRSGGMPVARVRAIQPPGCLVGRSVHEDDDPLAIAGADYVLFGTVFPSWSKTPEAPVAGVAGLEAWVGRGGAVPVVAVGGIDLDRCAAARDAGACGVAAIGLFASAYARGEAALAAVVRDVHAVFAQGERAE